MLCPACSVGQLYSDKRIYWHGNDYEEVNVMVCDYCFDSHINNDGDFITALMEESQGEKSCV